jgi:adenosine deaminase
VRDLSTFLDVFWAHQVVMSSYEVIERIAYETVVDCARDNVRLLELRYSPHFIAIGHPDLRFEEIHAAVLRGIARAQSECDNIGVGLIGILDRMQNPDEARAAMDFFIRHRETFVGVDLANDEIKFPAAPFACEFERARASGLRITVHAGETALPKAPANVREAVTLLGAERIGHGVMAVKDASLLRELAQRGTLLEVCPQSNVLIGLVPDTKSHPLSQLLAAGVKCCLNTDDPGIFGHSLVEEYARALDAGLVTLADLSRMNSWAARGSFLPLAVKRKHWPSVSDLSED